MSSFDIKKISLLSFLNILSGVLIFLPLMTFCRYGTMSLAETIMLIIGIVSLVTQNWAAIHNVRKANSEGFSIFHYLLLMVTISCFAPGLMYFAVMFLNGIMQHLGIGFSVV